MKKLGLFLVMALSLASCKTGCDAENVLTNGLANTIATAGHCSNVAAIQTSVTAFVSKVAPNVCSAVADATKAGAPPRGVIGTIVCPLVAQAAGAYVGSQIPAAWGCSAPGSTVGVLVLDACELLPF
jgi:hypothetical protein